MPRRAQEWWSSPVPTTSLKRSAFLDSCTQWLVSEANDAAESVTTPLFVRTVCNTMEEENDALPPAAGALSYTPDEAPLHGVCICCGAAALDRTVCANPFAQRCLVAVCANCVPFAAAPRDVTEAQQAFEETVP